MSTAPLALLGKRLDTDEFWTVPELQLKIEMNPTMTLTAKFHSGR